MFLSFLCQCFPLPLCVDMCIGVSWNYLEEVFCGAQVKIHKELWKNKTKQNLPVSSCLCCSMPPFPPQHMLTPQEPWAGFLLQHGTVLVCEFSRFCSYGSIMWCSLSLCYGLDRPLDILFALFSWLQGWRVKDFFWLSKALLPGL